jgi:hypothetical protein
MSTKKAYNLTQAELENSHLSRLCSEAGYASLRSYLNEHSAWGEPIGDVENALKRAAAFAVKQTPLPGGLVLVHAVMPDGRTLVVAWDREGCGYPVTDDLTDEESDEVFHRVFGV